ncbi:MAG: tRNA uridine-5-carboxymethylaminomethyl(34) synthesis GTPase MnmE [Candidatus Electrothrix sp. GW3-4]|uniref:tRNA uridine-5-carboxymethylaminomethyl(34) synthesis GTPase MnmE n=1 Tax=Candidatus Electrothrix sp. GW3-4 TaxID=3126740 RepID=UPI0030CBEF0D
MLLTADETIAAIATAPGIGGIGVIRISGSAAAAVLQRLFVPHRRESLHADGSFPSHRLFYGTVRDRHGTVLDEVMAVFMRAPHTYTREDVAEIQCHGSYLVQQAILAEILAVGTRAAEPGEFTKRAFLAGRIDLTQAEAVIDLLQAQSMGGVELAVGQLRGQLYQRIAAIRDALVEILAIVELALDFPDDETDILVADRLLGQVQEGVEQPLLLLLALADQGRVIREGIKAVIVGQPNVGKSSLLNQLLQEERALVTEIPGTTRDTIEELISVQGVPVHLIDTAGIREHEDAVEELGIERARQKMQEADLVLFVVDASQGLSERDRSLYASLDDRKRVVVFNKIDIADTGLLQELNSFFGAVSQVQTAAKSGVGIAELREAVYQTIIGEEEEVNERISCAPNLRHKMILEKTLVACSQVRQTLLLGGPADLLAVDLRAALDHLADIVGLTTSDDILDVLFSRFCLGK